MFNRRLIAIIALSCCFFESIGHDRERVENLGKTVCTYVKMENGFVVEELYYTSELSKILLFGEHKVFGISFLPIIFDNRFENFIKTVGGSSQSQLQEAIEDAILLSSYNIRAYSVSKLLNYLVEVLQNKILYIKDQIKHNFKWDPKSFSSMKKSVAWAAGLIAYMVITEKYRDKNFNNKIAVLGILDVVVGLGLFPVSYMVVKNGYNLLTINPNACHQYLNKYEELLAFVLRLKAQLEADGFITIKLTNGRIATVNDNELIIN